MQKVLLISPHFDDAVLSAGQFMAGRPDADVVTVFGGRPSKVMFTDYDKKCGFEHSNHAVESRRSEDSEALALLGARPIHWDFPDSQYGEPFDKSQVQTMILEQLNKENYEFMMAPLGLGHPDHEDVSDLVMEIRDQIGIPVFLWEDLPLRVVEPETVPPRLEKFKISKYRREHVGDGPMADKIRALCCYRSQIGTGILNPYVMYVPERFWRV